jgi:hypothetical protein
LEEQAWKYTQHRLINLVMWLYAGILYHETATELYSQAVTTTVWN